MNLNLTPDQQSRQAEGRYQSNLGFHNTSTVPQADFYGGIIGSELRLKV